MSAKGPESLKPNQGRWGWLFWFFVDHRHHSNGEKLPTHHLQPLTTTELAQLAHTMKTFKNSLSNRDGKQFYQPPHPLTDTQVEQFWELVRQLDPEFNFYDLVENITYLLTQQMFAEAELLLKQQEQTLLETIGKKEDSSRLFYPEETEQGYSPWGTIKIALLRLHAHILHHQALAQPDPLIQLRLFHDVVTELIASRNLVITHPDLHDGFTLPEHINTVLRQLLSLLHKQGLWDSNAHHLSELVNGPEKL